MKKSAALGISWSGGARNPHVFQYTLRFLCSGGTRPPFARDDFFTNSHTSGCEEVSALSWKSLTDYRTQLTASHHREKRAHERGGMRTVAPDASWSFCASADSHLMSVLMNRH
ncbi:MAG: hypothetical protein ACREYE_32525 [Gammaproteobacteria bacterium]